MQQLKREGAPDELIAQAVAARRGEQYLDARELEAVTLFARVQTQWVRSAADNLPVSLNYQGVEVVARVVGITLDEWMLHALQIMEAECLTGWVNKANNARKQRQLLSGFKKV